MDFISKKISEEGWDNVSYPDGDWKQTSYKVVKADDKTLEYVEHLTSKSSDKEITIRECTNTIDLSQMDPSKTKAGMSPLFNSSRYNFGIEATNGKKCIKSRLKTILGKASPDENEPKYLTRVTIFFGDQTMSQRVAKAMVHAIQLNGGKVSAPEPF